MWVEQDGKEIWVSDDGRKELTKVLEKHVNNAKGKSGDLDRFYIWLRDLPEKGNTVI